MLQAVQEQSRVSFGSPVRNAYKAYRSPHKMPDFAIDLPLQCPQHWRLLKIRGNGEMRATVTAGQLTIDKSLYDFVNNEAIPDSGIQASTFWKGFEALIVSQAPRNAALLARRDELQGKIDAWHRQNPGPQFDATKYKAFLRDIGYWVQEKESFAVSTAHVDPEIAIIAGSQLVVPVSNARYALNAANARWGSLYDALYGTDAVPEDGAPRRGGYNPQRGAKVIAFVRDFLDKYFALA